MTSYWCVGCGETFSDGEATLVARSLEDGGTEHIAVCPYCGYDEIEEAAQCAWCGKSMASGKLNGGYYCDTCMDYLTNPLREHLFAKAEPDAYAEFLHEMLSKRSHGNALDYLKTWGQSK